MDQPEYPEFDVAGWEIGDIEQLGARPKHWVIDPQDRQWLFKPVTFQHHADGFTFPKGED